jgi:hypothetical protein
MENYTAMKMNNYNHTEQPWMNYFINARFKIQAKLSGHVEGCNIDSKTLKKNKVITIKLRLPLGWISLGR